MHAIGPLISQPAQWISLRAAAHAVQERKLTFRHTIDETMAHIGTAQTAQLQKQYTPLLGEVYTPQSFFVLYAI